MSITIDPDPSDDLAFVGLVERVVASLDAEFDPKEFFLIEIKNWFDHKWLKFSGRTVVAFPERGVDLPRTGACGIESAMDESFREKVTFPPFNSNRIIREQWWAYDTPTKRHLIHRKRRRHSSWNLQRRVADFAESAVFVWFSSGTQANDQGSLMVYRVADGTVDTWYASLRKTDRWRSYRTKGISTAAFDALTQNTAEQDGAGQPATRSESK